MPVGIFGVLTYFNFLLAGCLYVFLRRKKKLVGFQLGMNISIVTGGLISICTGTLLILQYPLYFTPVTFISTIIGLLVGGLFGALFDYQTALTGYANGLMMGLMAPMLGSIIDTTLPFIVFIELLLIISLSIVTLSVRRS